VKSSARELSIGGVIGSSGSGIDQASKTSDLYNTGKVTFTATGDIENACIGGVLGRGITNPEFLGKTEFLDTGYIYNKGTIEATVISGKSISVGGITGGKTGDSIGETLRWGGMRGCLNTYNSGSVSVTSTGKVESLNVGGIAGNSCMVINSYNTGRISGISAAGTTLNVGGLAGSEVYVQNSYNIGTVSGKGSGTNFTGGIMGNASVSWGETEATRYAALNGFWLKQSKAGGINSDVEYAKGTYFYMRKGDIKKKENNFGKLINAISSDKEDPNAMVEDRYGEVYSFDSPAASVMTRTDDGPGKRENLNGTLLDNLNGMVKDRSDRMYRKWVIDGTNGGYPVLSSKPAVYNKEADRPDASVAKQIAGEYHAKHKAWTSTMIINADGTFKKSTDGDGGKWSYDGKKLTLKWFKWEPEILEQKSDGTFSSSTFPFVLTRLKSTVSDKPDSVNKPYEAADQNIAGLYDVAHKNWNDRIKLKSDGTFSRLTGNRVGKWTFDGKNLTLNWSTQTPEILELKPDGTFSSKAYKFIMKRTPGN